MLASVLGFRRQATMTLKTAMQLWLLLAALPAAAGERASNVARGPMLVEDMHVRIAEDGGEFLPVLDALLRALRSGVDPAGLEFSQYRLDPATISDWPALLQSWNGSGRFWGYDNGDRAEMSVVWFSGPREMHTLTVEMVPLWAEAGSDGTRQWVVAALSYED